VIPTRAQYFFTERGFFRKNVLKEEKFSQRYPAVYAEINKITSTSLPWRERVYLYIHDAQEPPLCHCGCGERCAFSNCQDSSRFTYLKFYSTKCKARAYGGVGNPFFGKNHSDETKEAIRVKKQGKTYSPEVNAKKVRRGAQNGMYQRCNYDVWLEKYGPEIALQKQLAANAKKVRRGAQNGMYGKSPSKKAGNSVKCWYKGYFCRSLSELSFIINYCERFRLLFETAETTKYKVVIGPNKTYRPDFLVNNKFIVEIKPKGLQKAHADKFSIAKAEFLKQGLTFKVIDPIKKLSYNDIFALMQTGAVEIMAATHSKTYNNFMKRYQKWAKR